jgi:hypothetical protein
MKISDMYMAAAFLAYGAELINVDRENPSRQIFEFGGEVEQIFVLSGDIQILRIERPTLDEVKTRFIGRSLCYPPDYVDAVRRIKSAIHDM